MENVKPTRSELLNLKRRVVLAERGHSLLKRKRDGLIIELRKMLKDVKETRKELVAKIKEGEHLIKEIQIMEGDFALKSTAFYLRQKHFIEVVTKNLMGVKVPKIEFEMKSLEEEDRTKMLLTLSHDMVKAVMLYYDIIKAIIETAEVEISLRNLLKEIESTKRRVNALENIVIPRLRSQMAWVKMMLDEAERENIFRLKTVKKKKASEQVV
ncbi:MAG: V-type ATP synthase subunit D [Candidatus Nanohaloarchaeota archaeon]|nr:V-type ATP synthase subunit D [Candidatus Nanohaloarchaeota archaeon]